MSVRPDAVESVLLYGDLSKLNEEQRLAYYRAVCESLGLNPLTRPFEYLWLNGRLTLYATRAAADQLRQIHGVTIEIVDQKQVGDLYIVHVRARTRDGRQDEDLGVIPIAGLKGDALANAILKCITKAKRRVTLSICGLGWLDETEVDAVPGVRIAADDSLSANAHAAIAAPSQNDASDAQTVLESLTDKQRAFYVALCQKFDIDPVALIEARGVTSADGVSTLIDYLRTASKPFPSEDAASRALTAIADRFQCTVSDVAKMIEDKFGWDGDLSTLLRGWAFWLESELHSRAQSQGNP